jgi:hypothetical protein
MAQDWRVYAVVYFCSAGSDLLGAVLHWPLGLEFTNMTQDKILQTLREVIAEAENFTTWTVSTPHLVELVKRAVEAEREACAKVCDDIATEDGWEGSYANGCAVAIRARGQA